MADEIKQIIRVSNTDIKGNIKLYHALTKIKGIGFSFANAICSSIDIDKNKKIGALSESEVKNIEDCILNPIKHNIPIWILNRRKDVETGNDLHLITSNLKFQTEMDVKNMKKIKSYKGMRHAFGLPTRGQRTRSNFRHGTSIGVQKSKTKMPKPSESKRK